MPHCVHAEKQPFFDNIVMPESGCEVAEHAERNAIAWAARHGLALEGTEVHVTHMPCSACARSLINAGVTKLTYDLPYRLTAGVELLQAAGIKVYKHDIF
jgi:dCMP deaminase